ncbi:uncharacterized protein LOC142238785 [Haematobia irritans]|uniref:uncharacterized protein LOC142238785 n=1 Tax=Haematobia irritans TaxID=7368 RepID=UPI003F501777
MANKTLCNVIAYLSAILSGLGTIFVVFLFAVAVTHVNSPRRNPDGSEAITITGTHVAILAFEVLSSGAMFIASVLLIIGIKRDRHQFVAPWVIIVAINVILNIVKMILDHNSWIMSLISIAIQIALWYPIFAFYRELRNNPIPSQDVTYNACPTNLPGGKAYQHGNVYSSQPQRKK